MLAVASPGLKKIESPATDRLKDVGTTILIEIAGLW